ncbi:MAG: hypothetical protein U5J96_17280 [Ignavibacteriaceae bacterium]|nr:hypothetical protein [Ignavibacteriaceae bacterium]
MTDNDSLRDELGKNARRRAFSELTAKKMVERTYKVYNDLLEHLKIF